jgi:hypothetical protein
MRMGTHMHIICAEVGHIHKVSMRIRGEDLGLNEGQQLG